MSTHRRQPIVRRPDRTMEVPQQSPRHRAITRIARQPYKIQQILAQVRAEIGVRPEAGPRRY